MRGRGKIGIAQLLAGKPSAGRQQPTNIGEMITDVMARGAHCRGIRGTAPVLAPHHGLVDALEDEDARHLVEELVVEPARQAPHFRPRGGIRWGEPPPRGAGTDRLLDVFGNHLRPGHRRESVLDQHRRGAGRIEQQEVLPSLPGALLHQPGRDAVLGKRKPYESRMRAEGVMEQRQHGLRRNLLDLCLGLPIGKRAGGQPADGSYQDPALAERIRQLWSA
jgi:hypothetical protein